MDYIRLSLPPDRDALKKLRAGDSVLLSGYLYTARDAAHKRLVECLNEGKELPFDINGNLIYYVGPAPAPVGRAVGSAGPTSSYRMDPYAPRLMDAGLAAMMGKGKRSDEVIRKMVEHGCVYFGAVGGAAARISKRIVKSELIAYEDLGAEAIRRFTVKDFPAVVLIDSLGNNIYVDGPKKYKTEYKGDAE